ncbi:hypothetical protein LUZ60_015342 [Juncus effusus]|nr:hypothetical protein LUZ60_015342 [Juncus effusus]
MDGPVDSKWRRERRTHFSLFSFSLSHSLSSLSLSLSQGFGIVYIVWMEISSAHHQLMASHPLEEVLGCPNTQNQNLLLHHQMQQNQMQENQSQVQNEQQKKPRPHPDQALKCPRCDSTNTKFCYYNNYSLSQPRYFCKSCRRYWTQGGSLRNVPVGGGCRKNKRSSPSPSNPSPTPKKVQENPQNISPMSNPNPNPNPNPSPLFSSLIPPPSDLTLAFACGLNKTNMIPLMHDGYPNPNGFLEILRGGGFGDNNGNGTNNSTNNGGFQGFYYGFGTNNGTGVDQAGSGNGEEMVMPSFEANVSAIEGTGPVEGANAVENVMMQGSTSSSSCKETLDAGLQWQQLDVNGNGNGIGNGNGLVSDSARDYWNNVGSASSSWYNSLVNSSMM